MSSQKGNVSRSRAQKHQNTTAFKNDKFGATPQVKKAKSKVHDGLCQHCKDVLEWKVKYNKYKPLTQPRKCVKCNQKNIKDAYHVVCKNCSLQLEICCKCGKKEEVVVPVNSKPELTEEDREGDCQKKRRGRRKDDFDEDEDDFAFDSECSEEDSDSNYEPRKTEDKTVLPNVSSIHVRD